MKTSQKVVAAALTIALGVLLIVLKSGLVNLVLVGLGVMLIVLGILNIVDKLVPLGVIKIVIGALVALFGGLFWKVMLYIVAALLLIYGILQLYGRIRLKVKCSRTIDTVIAYAAPVLCIVIALLLFFNQGGTINWIFVVAGVFTVIEGVLMLIDSLRKN